MPSIISAINYGSTIRRDITILKKSKIRRDSTAYNLQQKIVII
jgi:hypothetical protein